jgi:mono/diheme cytochrome c family protein
MTNSRNLLLFALVFAIIVGVSAYQVWRDSSSRQMLVINETAVPPVPTPDPERIAAGAMLYAQYCASCHGPDLKGAPDWKNALPEGSLPPPPQDSSGHTWHHPDALLVQIIEQGGDPQWNSKMPTFGDRLSREQIVSILDFIKSNWGKEERELQWWLTVTEKK